MEYLKRKPPAHSPEYRQPPTELANFTKQDMLQLYTEFTKGPEHPHQLYDVDIVATSLAGSKSDISYNEFQSQLLRRPVGLEMRKEEKRQRESSSEFKSVSELDPHWYDHSRTNSDLQMRQAATNLFHRCMEVNTWSSDDSIFCEFNRSRSSHGSSENASMKTHSNDGDKKDLTSKERMELETTETSNMV